MGVLRQSLILLLVFMLMLVLILLECIFHCHVVYDCDDGFSLGFVINVLVLVLRFAFRLEPALPGPGDSHTTVHRHIPR